MEFLASSKQETKTQVVRTIQPFIETRFVQLLGAIAIKTPKRMIPSPTNSKLLLNDMTLFKRKDSPRILYNRLVFSDDNAIRHEFSLDDFGSMNFAKHELELAADILGCNTRLLFEYSEEEKQDF